MERIIKEGFLVMGINMPVMHVFTATEWIKQFYAAVSILASGMFDDDVSIIKIIKNGRRENISAIA
jgi:DNA-binding NarL/FixJ family response regulator